MQTIIKTSSGNIKMSKKIKRVLNIAGIFIFCLLTFCGEKPAEEILRQEIEELRQELYK